MAMAARTTAVVSFAICFIFGVGCCWRGAVANGGGSCGGCVDNGSSCGVAFKLSNRFFGALAGARFFFGFRPRLLGIGFDHCRRRDSVGASAAAGARFPVDPTNWNAIKPQCGYIDVIPEPLRRSNVAVSNLRPNSRAWRQESSSSVRVGGRAISAYLSRYLALAGSQKLSG
jgi:hypothetical protein